MNNSTIVTIIGLVLAPLPVVSATPHSGNDGYAKCVFVDSMNNTTLPYRMLASETVEAHEMYPLIVFLHGSGERGTDNEKRLTHGASTFSNPANVDKYPSYVVFPQCKERTWTDRFNE